VNLRSLAVKVTPPLVGLIAFGVYRLTLSPGLTWAHAGTDGGDLVTAAAVWGVPHPPGYPTYTLLGHVFAQLPLGDPAFNLNLMSALCAALAAGLLAASVMSCAPRAHAMFAGSIAGLTLAFGPMLWGQAVIAEVHTLNALFVAAMCHLAPPWVDVRRSLSSKEKVGLGLAWGLGLGNSPTLAAMAPIALPALWLGARGRRIGFAALVAGLCVYVLVPIRASLQPPINWGNVSSVEQFVWLASGGLYRGYALAAPLDLVLTRLLALPRLWLEQLGWLGALWATLGLAARARRKLLVPALLTSALYAGFAVTYNTSDSDSYLIPVWVLSAGYLGIGLAHALERWASRAARALVGFVACLTIVGMLVGGWSAQDLSRDRVAAGFAETTLSALPPDAILVTHVDAYTFTLWYYRLVSGWRQDVSIVDERLAGYAWYAPMLQAQGAAPAMPVEGGNAALVDRLQAANPNRPLCEIISPRRDEDAPRLRCR
jgi:hypothetical protein